MEIMIELTEAELDEVGGGAGLVTVSFISTVPGTAASTVSGTTVGVSGTLTMATTSATTSVSADFSFLP